jgi:multidrug efflux pump subunit AcrB
MPSNAIVCVAGVKNGAELAGWANEAFPSFYPTLLPLQTGRVGSVQIQLSGRDREQLFKAADQDKEKFRLTPGPRWIDNDREAQVNKMVIMIDWARGRYAGLTSRNVAFSLYVETEGLEATEFQEGEELIAAVLRAAVRGRRSLANSRGSISRRSLREFGGRSRKLRTSCRMGA